MENTDNKNTSDSKVDEQHNDSEILNSDEKKIDTKTVSFLSKMTLPQKLFWGTLLLFFIFYILLLTMASINSSTNTNDSNSNVSMGDIVQDVELVVNGDRIRKNLENNETVVNIRKNMKKNILILEKKIDHEINYAFHSVYGNIDSFLDFHYSVVGEYVELGSMAMGNIEKTIENKLFGSDFSIRTKDALESIAGEYEIRLDEHFKFVDKKAIVNVDVKLNNEAIEKLQQDIVRNMHMQGGKMGTVATVAVAPAIAKAASAKIAAKSSTKIAAKVATKLGAKSAAAVTGAASGALCGPAFWICSPVAAGVLWFGTDAAVSSIDEIYSRDEFKLDIIRSLNQHKNSLKRRLKQSYTSSMKKVSQEVLSQYKQIPSKEIKRVKVREKLGL